MQIHGLYPYRAIADQARDAAAMTDLVEFGLDSEEDPYCPRCKGTGEILDEVITPLGCWDAFFPCPDCDGGN